MARKNFRAAGGINIDSTVFPITVIQETITSNSAVTVDSLDLTSFVSAEYTISLKQGSKIRTSKVIIQTDGTSVDMTEYSVAETGGLMSGVLVSATASGGNALLQVTVTDAASTNVRYKLVRNTLTKIGYPPDTPTIGTATGGFNTATVTFTAPTDDGGSAITTYTATANPSFVAVNTASSPATFTTLTPGINYIFTVTATNEFGTSAESSTSNSVLVSSVPSQVTGLTATDFGTSRAYNNGRIDLSWVAPANNGQSITGYRIQRSTDNISFSTIVADTGTTATTYSDTGLSSAQIYYYRVAAINANGTGSNSASANATATTVPQAPTIGTATAGAAGSGQATVSYTINATGGKSVTVYTATSSPGSLTGTGSSPITVTGLSESTTYTFTVTATNANGVSAASAASNSIILTPPASSWTARTSNVSGGTPINSVAYGNGVWVVSGQNVGGFASGASRRSTDGITWTTIGAPLSSSNNVASKLTYGNGIFVLTASSGNLWTSTDGITWTARTSNLSTGANTLYTGYGNGIWILGSPSDNSAPARGMRRSTDGITWTTLNNNQAGHSAYGNSVWVAHGVFPNSIWRSTDHGQNWSGVQVSNIGTNPNNGNISYGNGLFVGYIGSGSFFRSTDGITWTGIATNFSHNASTNRYKFNYGNGLWVAAQYRSPLVTNDLRTSTDGTTWITRSSGGSSALEIASYGNGIWVLVGWNGTIRTASG